MVERKTVVEATGVGVGAGAGVAAAVGDDPPPPHAAVNAATNATASLPAIAILPRDVVPPFLDG